MKLPKSLLIILFLTYCFWTDAQVNKANDSRRVDLNVHSDSTISIPKDHVWMIDTIEIESKTSPYIYLDSKRFSPFSGFPVLIEHNVVLDSLTGKIRIRGSELRISKEDYPLLIQDKK